MMAAREPADPLRVAVVAGSLPVPEWIAWTVARIGAAPGLELWSVTALDTPRRADGRSTAAGRLYEWADARAFGAAAALRPARLAPAATRDGEPDVVVALVADGRGAWPGPAPRLGVWALVPLEDGPVAPERFADVRDRRATTATALVRVDGIRWREIGRTTSPVHPLSLARAPATPRRGRPPTWSCVRSALRPVAGGRPRRSNGRPPPWPCRRRRQPRRRTPRRRWAARSRPVRAPSGAVPSGS